MTADVIQHPSALTDEEQRVLDAVTYGWSHIDAIAQRAGLKYRADAERVLKELGKKKRVAGVGLEWAKVRR